jgi:hypothetical protein
MLMHVVIKVLTDKEFNETAEKVNDLSKRFFSGDTQLVSKNTLPKKEMDIKEE